MFVQGSLVTTTITGTPADFTVTYNPPNDFGYNQMVAVSVTAQDQASPPNQMVADTYFFTVMKEKSESNRWLWPSIGAGIGAAVLIAFGVFLIAMRRKGQRGH